MISTYKNVQKQSLFLTVLGQSKKKEKKSWNSIWFLNIAERDLRLDWRIKKNIYF